MHCQKSITDALNTTEIANRFICNKELCKRHSEIVEPGVDSFGLAFGLGTAHSLSPNGGGLVPTVHR